MKTTHVTHALNLLLADAGPSVGQRCSLSEFFSKSQVERHSKIASWLGINTPNLQSHQPSPSVLANSGGQNAVLGPKMAASTSRQDASFFTQLFTQYRLKLGRELLGEAAAFRPFTLPAGTRLRKAAASVILPQQANPAQNQPAPVAPAPPGAAPAAHGAPNPAGAASAVLNQFMRQQPAAPIAGLTPGGPQQLTGSSAINNTIQTKGPISAQGDFGNPNAGQDVAMSASPTKMSHYRLLRRLRAR